MLFAKKNICFRAMVVTCAVFYFIAACKQPTAETKAIAETIQYPQCFVNSFQQDSILLHLQQKNDSVYGQLWFLPYEKDSRIGTLHHIKTNGDTLFALYISEQEGMTDTCEIAMLKFKDGYILNDDFISGNNYNMSNDYSKGFFEKKTLLQFKGDTLRTVDCQNIRPLD